jgi:hypothetical protein
MGAVKHKNKRSDAKQGQGDIPVSDQTEQDIENEIQYNDLNNEPPVAVNQRNPENSLPGSGQIPVHSISQSMEQHAQCIGHPEWNKDGGKPGIQELPEIILPGINACNKAVSGKKEEYAHKTYTEVLKDIEKPGIIAAGLLYQMV